MQTSQPELLLHKTISGFLTLTWQSKPNIFITVNSQHGKQSHTSEGFASMKFLEVKKYGKLLQQMPYFKFDFELVVFDTMVF